MTFIDAKAVLTTMNERLKAPVPHPQTSSVVTRQLFKPPGPEDGLIPCVRVQECGGDKGKGVFADVQISQGELVFAETPLLLFAPGIPSHDDIFLAISRLPKWAYMEYMKLFDIPIVDAVAYQKLNPGFYNKLAVSDDEHNRWHGRFAKMEEPCMQLLLNIFYANALQVEQDQAVVIGRLTSRINHSCRPNANYHLSGNETQGFRLEIRACRNINPGSEITIAYCDVFEETTIRKLHLKDTCKQKQILHKLVI
jgi:hypothetical protein